MYDRRSNRSGTAIHRFSKHAMITVLEVEG